MPKAEFYLSETSRFREDPLLLVCELARRAFDAGIPTLILARDAAQAEALDEKLWSFDDDAYVAHQIAGDEDDDATPVLIVPPEFDAPARPLVINLRDSVPRGPLDTVQEIVPADPAAREESRRRWRAYQARGFEVSKRDL